jgi:hypothetical protein
MDLKLKKKKLKNLSQDNKLLPFDATPQVAGATPAPTDSCQCDRVPTQNQDRLPNYF